MWRSATSPPGVGVEILRDRADGRRDRREEEARPPEGRESGQGGVPEIGADERGGGPGSIEGDGPDALAGCVMLALLEPAVGRQVDLAVNVKLPVPEQGLSVVEAGAGIAYLGGSKPRTRAFTAPDLHCWFILDSYFRYGHE